jgi:hypothetical protein
MILAARDQVQYLRLKHVSTRVDVLTGGLIRLWLFQETAHAAIAFSFNHAVSAGVFDGSEHDGRDRVSFLVLPDDGFQIEVGQNVAVENYGGLANQLFGKFIRARGAHRLLLDHVFQLHAKVRTIAELLFDLLRLIRKRKRDVGHAGAAQRVDLIEEKRPVADGDDRFGCVNGERTQPCALSTCQYQCLHDYLIRKAWMITRFNCKS